MEVLCFFVCLSVVLPVLRLVDFFMLAVVSLTK